MNSKAENFQKYLQEKEIQAFQVDEIQGDEQGTVVFRSHIEVEGQQLPAVLIVDNSVFGILRVQISPQALQDEAENQTELLKLASEECAKFKPFKVYFDAQGNMLLDVCVIFDNDELDGDKVYQMFAVIINYLEANYRRLMKRIW